MERGQGGGKGLLHPSSWVMSAKSGAAFPGLSGPAGTPKHGKHYGKYMKIILRRGRAVFLQFVQSLRRRRCICCMTLRDGAPEAPACRRRFARHTPPPGSGLSFHKGGVPRRGKVKTGRCCRTCLGTAKHGGLGAAGLVREAGEQGEAGGRVLRGQRAHCRHRLLPAGALPLSVPQGSKVQKQQNPWCV